MTLCFHHFIPKFNIKQSLRVLGVKGKPKGKLTLQTSLLHTMSLVNKVASSLRSHLAILHQLTQLTCCVIIVRPISWHG